MWANMRTPRDIENKASSFPSSHCCCPSPPADVWGFVIVGPSFSPCYSHTLKTAPTPVAPRLPPALRTKHLCPSPQPHAEPRGAHTPSSRAIHRGSARAFVARSTTRTPQDSFLIPVFASVTVTQASQHIHQLGSSWGGGARSLSAPWSRWRCDATALWRRWPGGNCFKAALLCLGLSSSTACEHFMHDNLFLYLSFLTHSYT